MYLWGLASPESDSHAVQAAILKTDTLFRNYRMTNATLEWRGHCIIKSPFKLYMLEGIPPKSNEIGDFYQIGWPDPWP